jgi:hypothetical protein
VTSPTITHALIGSAALGVVGASLLVAFGRASLALPVLGGVAWGIANVLLLRRVVRHVRPDQTVPLGKLLTDLIVKFPAMYAVAFVLLWKRPVADLVAAAAGFGLVLMAMLLRSVGALFTPRPLPRRRRTQGA